MGLKIPLERSPYLCVDLSDDAPAVEPAVFVGSRDTQLASVTAQATVHASSYNSRHINPTSYGMLFLFK